MNGIDFAGLALTYTQTYRARTQPQLKRKKEKKNIILGNAMQCRKNFSLMGDVFFF